MNMQKWTIVMRAPPKCTYTRKIREVAGKEVLESYKNLFDQLYVYSWLFFFFLQNKVDFSPYSLVQWRVCDMSSIPPSLARDDLLVFTSGIVTMGTNDCICFCFKNFNTKLSLMMSIAQYSEPHWVNNLIIYFKIAVPTSCTGPSGPQFFPAHKAPRMTWSLPYPKVRFCFPWQQIFFIVTWVY